MDDLDKYIEIRKKKALLSGKTLKKDMSNLRSVSS